MMWLRRLWARLFYMPSIGVFRLMCLLRWWRVWDRVDDHVLLGGAPTYRAARRLAAMNVTSAIAVCEPYEWGRRAVMAAGIDCLMLPVVDYTRPDEETIRRAVGYIGQCIEAGNSVLIFCKAGRVRSASVVLGDLIVRYGLEPADALAMIRRARPQVDRRIDKNPAIRAIAKPAGTPADAHQPHGRPTR